MLRIIIHIIFILTSTSLFSQTDILKWNLKGSIRKTETISYKIEDNKSTKTIIEKYLIEFRKDGETSKRIITNDKQTRVYFDIPNIHNKDSLTLVYINDTLDHMFKYKYLNGLIKEEILADSNGFSKLSTFYFYDKNSVLIKDETFSGIERTNMSNYVYHKSGLLIQELWYNKDDQLSENWTYKYDTLGNEIENTMVDIEENEFIEYTYVFNKNKDWIKVTELNINNNSVAIEEWKYKYDLQNNWISQNHYKDGILIDAKKRVIYYY